MLKAVLFDWGATLMDFVWDDELVEEGHRAGLQALGRDDPAELARLSAHFRERYLPLLHAPGTLEEVEYPGLVAELLEHVGIEASADDAQPVSRGRARGLGPGHAGGLDQRCAPRSAAGPRPEDRPGSNATDPGWLLRVDLERQGLAPYLDSVVFSSEVGKRKPHPAIFERALAELGVPPEQALFVGDRLYEDVGGAAALGMTTVQAIWFRADEGPHEIEPDFQAFTQMDVLNVVERLDGAG